MDGTETDRISSGIKFPAWSAATSSLKMSYSRAGISVCVVRSARRFYFSILALVSMIVYFRRIKVLNDAPQPKSYITRLRGVPMLPEERVAQVLSLQDGIVDEPPSDGRLLVATNLRIIYLQQDKGDGEASLLPVEELNGVVVNSRTRSSISWFQGILMVLTALLFYLVIAYWFAGRFDAPYLPVINMDMEVLIILAAIVIGGWFFWRQTFRRAGGLVTLRGSNWSLSIDYLGADKSRDVYTMVNTLFLYRQSRIAIGQQGNESEATPSHLS